MARYVIELPDSPPKKRFQIEYEQSPTGTEAAGRQKGPWEKYQKSEPGPWDKYKAPDQKTQNEAAALEMIQSQDPTTGMTTTQKALAGTGKAFSDVYQGLTQLESRLPDVLQSPVRHALSLTKKPEQIDAEINETKRLDAPLMNTTAGKVGNIAGNIAVAAPTAFIPGVNTTVGAGLVGASQGLIQPVAEGDSRALNTVLGGVLGAGGQKIGQAIGNKISSAIEARKLAQAQNVGRDSMLAGAKEAGYVVPPSSVNPSVLNSTLEGLSGKIKTAQLASQKNQNVTNSLVRKALGVADDQPITPELLTGIRRQAGEAYEAIKGVGRIQADDQGRRTRTSSTALDMPIDA